MNFFLNFLSAVGLLIGISLFTHNPGETETNQAGNSLRIDFEGTHKVKKFEIPEPYLSGHPQRLDFEGIYAVRKIEIPEPYESGVPQRIDFEGVYYKQKTD